MSGWLHALLLAVALMGGTWALLVALARRLPPGVLHDLAGFVPDCVTTVRRLRGDPEGAASGQGRGRAGGAVVAVPD